MAIRVEQITTLEQISKIIWDQQYQSTLMRNRSPYLYRGLPNSNYHLVTSLRRNCKEKKNDIELAILRNFVKYAALEDPALKTSIWRQMIVGQHHGLPSRLLDWTYSVLIALHFATSGENLDDMSKNDAVLWQIDILEMNKRLPKNYQTTLKNESAFLMTVESISLTKKCSVQDCPYSHMELCSPSFPEFPNTPLSFMFPLYFSVKRVHILKNHPECSFVQISLLKVFHSHTFHYTFHSNIIILIAGI